jgi:hypothetical protein
MKKTSLIFAVLTLTSAFAFAEKGTETNTQFTLAAAELSVKSAWVDTEEDVQLRLEEDLSDNTDKINAKINAKLEKQLADKLARDLDL